MGMAAGQARLLSITARINHNELRAQQITNAKIRLSDATQAASDEYLKALSDTELEFLSYDSMGNQTRQPLTGNCLTYYGPLKNQYGLINSAGQIMVSEIDGANFKNSNTLNEFLNKYGLVNERTETTIPKVLNPEYINQVKAFEAWESKKSAHQIDVTKYKNALAVWKANKPKKENYPDSETAETALGYATHLNASLGYRLSSKDTYSFLCAASAMLQGTTNPSYKDALGFGSGIHSIEDHTDSGYWQNQYCWQVSYVDPSHSHAISGLYGDRNSTDALDSETLKLKMSNGETLEDKLAKLLNTYGFSSNCKFTPDAATNLVTNKVPPYFGQGTNADGYNEFIAILDELEEISNDNSYEEALDNWDNDKPEDPGEFTEEKPEITAEQYIDGETVVTTYYDYTDADQAQWYINLWHRMNGESDFKSGTEAEDGSWVSASKTNENYVILEDNLMNSPEWLEFALKNGVVTLEQVQFDEPTETGTGLSHVAWTSLEYTSVGDISEQTNQIAITKAEVKYNNALKEIEAKDKRYDTDLKNLDTEHNALQTEYESIKGTISKNVERSFKAFS